MVHIATKFTFWNNFWKVFRTPELKVRKIQTIYSSLACGKAVSGIDATVLDIQHWFSFVAIFFWSPVRHWTLYGWWYFRLSSLALLVLPKVKEQDSCKCCCMWIQSSYDKMLFRLTIFFLLPPTRPLCCAPFFYASSSPTSSNIQSTSPNSASLVPNS